MELRVLGPVELEGAGGVVPIPGKKERSLLAYLALRANEVVSEDALADAVWGGEPPPSAARTLQAYVSRVRKACAEADPDGSTFALDSQPGGWVLRVARGALDITRVDALIGAVRDASAAGDSVGAALTMAEAQRCWRGQALSEFADLPWAVADAVRLEEMRIHVVEERIDLELACGRHSALVGELEALCASHPLRERLWGQRMVALYRAGRQAEALRVYQDLRAALRDELGIEPSPPIARIEADILQQVPALEWTDRAPVAPRVPTTVAITSPPLTAEHRVASAHDPAVVTLLFTDIVQSTELLTRLGDDSYEAMRRAHFRLLREAVSEAGGNEVKSLGDGLMAVFVSTVDALACAVAMQQAVARHNRRALASGAATLDVRIGVHVGEPIRDEDDYFGTPVVIARRLCDRAEGGQILASRLVADFVGSRGSFGFEDIGAVELKGIDHPVAANRVVWEDEPPRPLPAALPSLREQAFVGRDAELRALSAAWQRAQSGQLEVVLLAGEPGIGKTTLAVQQAVSAWASGAIVLFGRCDEESLVPFQPFVEALAHYIATTSPATLRTQLGTQADDVALLVPELGRVLPEVAGVAPSGAETERYRLFEAVPALLRAIGEEAPVLLILDDLHWADRPTLQLFQHIIRRGAGTPLLVLGTYRDTDLVRTHPMAETLADLRRASLVTRLPMRGLGRDDVLAMVVGGGVIDGAATALADALWAETEGSPLFLREILRHLAETDVIDRDESGRWRALRRIDQLGIPEGVREVIGRRLTRLSDDANTALRAGSVMGRELRLDVLEAITDLGADTLLDTLDEAVAAGVIDEVPEAVGRYAFTHALVRQALYDELSITRRVRLHQRVGEALERIHHDDAGTQLAELAHHFTQAAVAGQSAKAIEYAARAGEHARGLVAYEDAARHYENALEVAEDAHADATRCADLLQAIGECYWLAGNQRAARRAFERVVDLAGSDPHRLARAALGHAGAGFRTLWADIGIANETGIALLEQALDALPTPDSTMRARLLACLAQELYFVAGSNERRHELSSEGVEMARRLGDPATLVHALLARNLAVLGPATAAERLAYATEAGALAISLGERQLEGHSAFHRFTAFAELDDMPAASVEQDRCLTLLGELRDPVEALARPAYEAGVATLEGRFADANRLIHLAFQRGQEARDPNALVFFASGITPLRYFQGRSEELLAVAEEFRDAFPLLNPAVCCMLAGFNAEVGRHEAARSCLAEYDIADYSEMAGGAMWSYAAHNLARACWRLGDAERSAALYDLLLPHADLNACVATLGWGSFQLPLAWCALTCGRLDDAAEHFEAALVAHARNGWLAALADTQLHFATMLASRDGSGDRERARALLDEVSVTATKLGMSAHLQQADDLRQAMIGVPAHAVARPVRTITRRERARAMLTARGRATVARWTRGDSDEDLVRRFGGDVAQRALFTGMTRSFQSVRAFGFSGDLVFELRPPEDELDPASSDWWTIEVHGRKASARRGRSAEAVSTIHIGLADFVRVTSGELSIATAILDGRLDIDGDVLLAARIPELFGASAPIEGLGHAAEG